MEPIHQPTKRERWYARIYYTCLSTIIIALVSAICMCSCTTTRYVPVIEHHTDTVQITKQQRDSIWLHDSISVKEKNDTIRIEKWHTKYVEKQVHDTTYVSHTDTIPQPYPVEVEVEKQLTWWQRFRLSIANIILGALLIYVLAWGLKKYWHKFL